MDSKIEEDILLSLSIGMEWSVLDKACVAKILICKINLNLIIQKSKLKINRQDEKWYLSSL